MRVPGRRDGLRIVSLEELCHVSQSPLREILSADKAFSPADTAAARVDIKPWLKAQPG
jgi:hypothetical protein